MQRPKFGWGTGGLACSVLGVACLAEVLVGQGRVGLAGVEATAGILLASLGLSGVGLVLNGLGLRGGRRGDALFGLATNAVYVAILATACLVA